MLKMEANEEGRRLCFDCWVLSKEPFVPKGRNKPSTP
jgi:hypothetical protein